MFSSLAEVLLSFVSPIRCVSCGRQGRPLCSSCHQGIDFCLFTERPPPHLASLTTMAAFAGPIKDLVMSFKFGPYKPAAQLAGELLYWHTWWPDDIEVVTWAPLTKNRLHERTYNQAEVMARSFCQHTQLPALQLLTKPNKITPQAEVSSREERATRLVNCYTPAHSFTTWPNTVLVIDDVCTTGSTLNECARALKSVGVKSVHGLTLAKEQ